MSPTLHINEALPCQVRSLWSQQSSRVPGSTAGSPHARTYCLPYCTWLGTPHIPAVAAQQRAACCARAPGMSMAHQPLVGDLGAQLPTRVPQFWDLPLSDNTSNTPTQSCLRAAPVRHALGTARGAAHVATAHDMRPRTPRCMCSRPCDGASEGKHGCLADARVCAPQPGRVPARRLGAVAGPHGRVHAGQLHRVRPGAPGLVHGLHVRPPRLPHGHEAGPNLQPCLLACAAGGAGRARPGWHHRRARGPGGGRARARPGCRLLTGLGA